MGQTSMTKSQSFSRECEFVKVDDGLGLVFGFAVICTEGGVPYVDLQKDHCPEDAMVEAALDLMLSNPISGDNHARDAAGQPVADGRIPFAFPLTTEIAKALGIQTERTGLLVALKPGPEVLQKFKDGIYKGFSIGGGYIENEEAPLR